MLGTVIGIAALVAVLLFLLRKYWREREKRRREPERFYARAASLLEHSALEDTGAIGYPRLVGLNSPLRRHSGVIAAALPLGDHNQPLDSYARHPPRRLQRHRQFGLGGMTLVRIEEWASLPRNTVTSRQPPQPRGALTESHDDRCD